MEFVLYRGETILRCEEFPKSPTELQTNTTQIINIKNKNVNLFINNTFNYYK